MDRANAARSAPTIFFGAAWFSLYVLRECKFKHYFVSIEQIEICPLVTQRLAAIAIACVDEYEHTLARTMRRQLLPHARHAMRVVHRQYEGSVRAQATIECGGFILVHREALSNVLAHVAHVSSFLSLHQHVCMGAPNVIAISRLTSDHRAPMQ